MQNLFQHINQFISFSEEEFAQIRPYFEVLELNKKETIARQNAAAKANYFVLEGCLHMYFINTKGVNQTVQFALENWWLNDALSFYKQASSEFYIQAIEPSTIAVISYAKQEEILSRFSQLERYFRIMYQIAYGSALKRVQIEMQSSKEYKYFNFIEKFPAFANRVPQYLIASFLGLTPEYVSEIRAKKRT